MLDYLRDVLPEDAFKVVELVYNHNKWRKKETLNMIPSENVTSPLVDMVYMSDMMHRYAEGMPFKRFYQGNIYVDRLEVYAGEIIKELNFSLKAGMLNRFKEDIEQLFDYQIRGIGGDISSVRIMAANILSVILIVLLFKILYVIKIKSTEGITLLLPNTRIASAVSKKKEKIAF